VIEPLFRRSYSRLVATLTRILGSEHLSLAEDAVQDALVSAMQQWGMHGVPDDPDAWLFRVARNKAIDHLRRDAKSSAIPEELAVESSDRSGFAHELDDDELRMMLMCCHPALPEESRTALTLKTVCAFSVDEIARAFVTKSETIAQRIVRAKRLIRDEKIAMAMPSRDELPGRRDSLLQVLYLMFNEGYSASCGDELVRRDVCREAIRLTRAIATHAVASSPAAHALLSLMLLQAARVAARVDAAGELILLEEQDRSLWDPAMLAEGIRELARSAEGEVVTRYHLEAGIAACHAAAPSFDETDWPRIVELYDELMKVHPSPVVALNRAIAVAMVDGPQAGIAELERLDSLRDYLPRLVALGELWRRAGDAGRAAGYFAQALELPSTSAEKRYLLRMTRLTRSG